MLGLFGTVIGGVAVVLGLALIAIGHIGALRFYDLYTRVHSVSVADGAGATLFLLGLALMAPDFGMAMRLVLLAILMWAIAPLLAHLNATAAHHGGLAPRVGSRALGGDAQ